MTQIFDADGNVVPVTAVEAGPCFVLELKNAPLKVKLGFMPIKESKVKKPQLGYFKKIGVAPVKYVEEFHSTDNKDYKVGQEIKADFFKAGDFVNVIGTSMGKGFQGGMKRWHWKGGPATHGSTSKRRPGSIGSGTDPGRVWKGHHMPGHMGDVPRTIQNLRVVEIDHDLKVVAVKGSVPGHRDGFVFIKPSTKRPPANQKA